jgi:hypothetical protein
MITLAAFSAVSFAKEQLLIGSFTIVKGKVNVKRGGEEKWEKAEADMPVYPGDMVKTEAKSEAELILDDGSMLRIEEKTTIEVVDSKIEGEGETTKKSFLLNLLSGKTLNNLKKLINKESKYNVATKTAVAGVRGTEFSVECEEEITEVAVFEGEVDVTNKTETAEGEAVKVSQNQQTTVEKGKVPLTPQALNENSRLYRENIVARFHERVEQNRLRIEEIRNRRNAKIEAMKKKVEDFREKTQQKLEQNKKRPK